MSQALERFQKTNVYETVALPDEILADIDAIRSLDKTKEGEAKKFGCIGALLIPITIVASIGLAAIHPALVFVSLALFGGGAIWLLVKAYSAHKQDVEDRRYELLRSLVDLIRRDLGAETPLKISMSLRPAARQENFQTKGQAGLWKFKLYHDAWLQLEARLLDGTTCRIQLTERMQKRHRWKTSASGKRKLKQKVKSAMEVHVRLKPKTRRYANLAEIGQEAQGAVQLPEWAFQKGLAVEEGGLALRAVTKAEWDAPAKGEKPKGPHGVHLIAMSLMSLYQILNLSRAITKSQGSQS